MPRANPFQNNFSSGEFRPELEGRVDIERYASAVKTLRHFMVTTPGGATRRMGSHFVAEVKDSTKRVRLIPFEFSDTQAYVMEHGDGYIRFFMNHGQVLSSGTPYEITSPYAVADLPKIKHVQSADVMYQASGSHPVQKITRTGHTAWTMTPVTFLPPPTAEEPIQPAATLTPAATSGTDIVFTASASVFLAADVDRIITYGASRAVIQTVTSGTVVHGDILDAFPSTSAIAAGAWALTGSPNCTLTPDKKEPKGTIVTVVTDLAAFRAADVGKYVKVHDGLIKVTQFASAVTLRGELIKELTGVTGVTAGNWTLEVAAWSASRGYPFALSFHEGRLDFGGSLAQPQQVWGSVVGDFENMALGTDPADAFEFGIAANKVNIIRWFLPSRVLLVGTKGGEFRITGGLDQAITPTNVDAKSETVYGSNLVAPVRVGASILFVQRSGRKLRELAFSQDLDAYVAPELSVLAAHLLPVGTTIVEMDFQQDPEPVLWIVRSDGMLLSMTYDRSNNVVGWAQHPMDGVVESVCVIPHPDGDREQVWLAVRRTINGQTKRYIEYLDDAGGYYGQLNTDCTLTYNAAPATTFAGLDHLRGKVVDIVGDGAYYGQQTVPLSGTAQVTISPAASRVEVGLPFAPTPTIEQLRAEVPSQTGTAQGKKKRLSKVIVRTLRTLGLRINGHADPARVTADALGQAPVLRTEDIDGTKLGWDLEGRNLIEAPLPFPATVLGIFGSVDVGDD